MLGNYQASEYPLQTSIPFIEEKLNYIFQVKTVLIQAFTHRSYLNEVIPIENKRMQHNERLEFLGDAIIDLFVTETLFNSFPDHDEGWLSKQKATLVSEKSLSALIEQFNVAHYLLMGRGERIQQSYKRASISADLFEAIVGAIYIDGGYEKVTQFVTPLFNTLISDLTEKEVDNPKAALQELLAKAGRNLPEYLLTQENGPQHMKQFVYSVLIDGVVVGSGSGVTKKEAQKQAAKRALIYIENNGLPQN